MERVTSTQEEVEGGNPPGKHPMKKGSGCSMYPVITGELLLLRGEKKEKGLSQGAIFKISNEHPRGKADVRTHYNYLPIYLHYLTSFFEQWFI